MCLEHGLKRVGVVEPGDDSSEREVRRIFGAFETLDVVLEALVVDDGADDHPSPCTSSLRAW